MTAIRAPEVLSRAARSEAVGGVLSTRALTRAGATKRVIRDCVDDGSMRRLRRGWYSLANADPRVVRAVEAGGGLGCVSALSWYGVWTPPAGGEIHVRTSRGRARGELVRTCSTHLHECAPRAAVDPLEKAIQAMVWCLDLHSAVACLDSVMDLGLADRGDLHALFPAGSVRPHRLIDCCEWAQSGTESLVRMRLRALHLPVLTQVEVAGVGRVDLLVGDRLVIEVDSRAHHTSQSAYHEDRRRDRELLARGHVVMRLTWEQVMFSWSEVEQDILAVTRRHEHMWRRARIGQRRRGTRPDGAV